MSNQSAMTESDSTTQLRISFILDSRRDPELAYLFEMQGHGDRPRELVRLAKLGLKLDQEMNVLRQASQDARLREIVGRAAGMPPALVASAQRPVVEYGALSSIAMPIAESGAVPPASVLHSTRANQPLNTNPVAGEVVPPAARDVPNAQSNAGPLDEPNVAVNRAAAAPLDHSYNAAGAPAVADGETHNANSDQAGSHQADSAHIDVASAAGDDQGDGRDTDRRDNPAARASLRQMLA